MAAPEEVRRSRKVPPAGASAPDPLRRLGRAVRTACPPDGGAPRSHAHDASYCSPKAGLSWRTVLVAFPSYLLHASGRGVPSLPAQSFLIPCFWRMRKKLISFI